jgi:hypothetical protein
MSAQASVRVRAAVRAIRLLETASFWFVFEFLEPLGQAIETETVWLVECRTSRRSEAGAIAGPDLAAGIRGDRHVEEKHRETYERLRDEVSAALRWRVREGRGGRSSRDAVVALGTPPTLGAGRPNRRHHASDTAQPRLAEPLALER